MVQKCIAAYVSDNLDRPANGLDRRQHVCNSLRKAFIELDHDIINGELHTVPIKSC